MTRGHENDLIEIIANKVYNIIPNVGKPDISPDDSQAVLDLKEGFDFKRDVQWQKVVYGISVNVPRNRVVVAPDYKVLPSGRSVRLQVEKDDALRPTFISIGKNT